MDVISKVVEIAKEVFEDESLLPTSLVKDAAGYDSMAVAQFLAVLEQEFSVDLVEVDASVLDSVAMFAHEVERRLE